MSSTRRVVIPSTRIAVISPRLEAPLHKVLQARDVPKLSKDQLAQHRNEVKKYYSELSRKKTSSAAVAPKQTRPKLAPPPPPPLSAPRAEDARKKFVTQRKPPGKPISKKPSSPAPSNLPMIVENPAEVAWEEVVRLVQKLSEMRPVSGITEDDVEKLTETVRGLIAPKEEKAVEKRALV